jgi:hypothetical protein
LVWVAGFEPAASWLQVKSADHCATPRWSRRRDSNPRSRCLKDRCVRPLHHYAMCAYYSTRYIHLQLRADWVLMPWPEHIPRQGGRTHTQQPCSSEKPSTSYPHVPQPLETLLVRSSSKSGDPMWLGASSCHPQLKGKAAPLLHIACPWV